MNSCHIYITIYNGRRNHESCNRDSGTYWCNNCIGTVSKNPKLRRDNRIKPIHSFFAIKQNTLIEKQVSDVIDGFLEVA